MHDELPRCLARNCKHPPVGPQGMCPEHRQKTKFFWANDDTRPNGRLYDLLGMRLNVFKESRGACTMAPGPCELAICRHHLDDNSPITRFSKISDLSEPCALKLALEGGMTLEDVGSRLGITRERVRQVEYGALKKLAGGIHSRGFRRTDVLQIIATAERSDPVT